MKKVSCFLICLLLIPSFVYAISINTSKRGELTMIYKYSSKVISDANIKLYKVAKYSSTGTLSYETEFDLTDSLEFETASQLNDLATKVNTYINEHGIEPKKECTTNDEGECTISNVSVGMYLLVAETKTIGNYKYSSGPYLIGVPNYDYMNNVLIYDIDVFLKTEAECLDCETPPIGPTPLPKFRILTSVIGGEITPGSIVESGNDVTILYSPAPGYRLVSVTVDGVPVNIELYPNTYTFTKVSDDHDIEVVYDKVSGEDPSKPDNGKTPGGEDKPSPSILPQTLDTIYTYVLLLGGSIVVILVIVVYVVIKKKREEGIK